MGYALQVFVSSTCYELRDLRASIKIWLENLGLTPLMSDESGFPHVDGMQPYATCLRVLEDCPLVIAVIDRHYGQGFDNWSPYPQHRGCAPTHAELRHALDLGKRVLIYVQRDTWNFYEVWRKNPKAFATSAPHGLDERTLQMFHELKQRRPVPWMTHFADVTELLQSLNSEFVNQLYAQLREREKETTDLASYVLEKLLDAAPEVREKIASELNPSLIVDRETLRQQLTVLETQLERMKGSTQETIDRLEREKNEVRGRMDAVAQQVKHTTLLLAKAAIKDVSWLDFVRRTMMPKQPGRIPFHHSAEVAFRGFNTASGQRQRPLLNEVTWSKLPYTENGLHRGYKAGILFKGGMFSPGVTFSCRRRTDNGQAPGNTEHPWQQPNIYFGDYLEVSSDDDEIEGPLSWRDYEFQVRNPEGQTSEWVPFTYPFNEELLETVRAGSLERGNALFAEGKFAESVEPLRKAYVFSDRILGVAHEETLRIKLALEAARGRAALAKLRFRAGDEVSVISGSHAGKFGVVEELQLNHLHAYVIKLSDGEVARASDEQVAEAPAGQRKSSASTA